MFLPRRIGEILSLWMHNVFIRLVRLRQKHQTIIRFRKQSLQLRMYQFYSYRDIANEKAAKGLSVSLSLCLSLSLSPSSRNGQRPLTRKIYTKLNRLVWDPLSTGWTRLKRDVSASIAKLHDDPETKALKIQTKVWPKTFLQLSIFPLASQLCLSCNCWRSSRSIFVFSCVSRCMSLMNPSIAAHHFPSCVS